MTAALLARWGCGTCFIHSFPGTQCQALSILRPCSTNLNFWPGFVELRVPESALQDELWRAGDAAGGEVLQSYTSKCRGLGKLQCFVLSPVHASGWSLGLAIGKSAWRDTTSHIPRGRDQFSIHRVSSTGSGMDIKSGSSSLHPDHDDPNPI